MFNPLIVLAMFFFSQSVFVSFLAYIGFPEAEDIEAFVHILPWPFVVMALFV